MVYVNATKRWSFEAVPAGSTSVGPHMLSFKLCREGERASCKCNSTAVESCPWLTPEERISVLVAAAAAAAGRPGSSFHLPTCLVVTICILEVVPLDLVTLRRLDFEILQLAPSDLWKRCL